MSGKMDPSCQHEAGVSRRGTNDGRKATTTLRVYAPSYMTYESALSFE